MMPRHRTNRRVSRGRRSWRAAARAFARLNWSDRRLIVSALVLEAAIGLALRRLPFRFSRMLVNGASVIRRGTTTTHAPERILWAITSVAARVPLGGSCLTQALAGRVLLARKGCASEVWVGVRKRGGRLHGHAWLVREGAVVLGGRAAQRYTPFARVL